MSKTLAKSFTLPGTSIALNRMGYGCMQLAGPGVWGPPKDPEAAVAVLRAAAEAGVNHFDTSDFYGPHTTNRVLRQALHPYKNLTVVTKIGFARGEDKSWFPAKSADDLTRAVHDNLTNLGLEALEVVNLRLGGAHGPDDASVKAPLSVLLELQKKRLVRHIGLSTVTAKQVAEARAMAPIVCVQNLYNLANRTDDALVDDLAKEGIAFVPYFPLGGFSPLQSSALDGVAKELGATSMQVALAWLLQRAPNILLIPGTSSVAHLKENLAASSLTLAPAAIAALDGISRGTSA
jgi:pyridoxine 4-dehydrogenase